MHNHRTPCIRHAGVVLHGFHEIQTRHGILDHHGLPIGHDNTRRDGCKEFAGGRNDGNRREKRTEIAQEKIKSKAPKGAFFIDIS